MLSFKPNFSLSSLNFIKRPSSSSSLSVMRVVSSAYLRLLIFLLAILIPVCASFSLAFHKMYSACKYNMQCLHTHTHTHIYIFTTVQQAGWQYTAWCSPFPIWNQSIVPCPVLTVASWPAYIFLRKQVRWSGIPISWRIFHNLLWSTQSIWEKYQ